MFGHVVGLLLIYCGGGQLILLIHHLLELQRFQDRVEAYLSTYSIDYFNQGLEFIKIGLVVLIPTLGWGVELV